MFSRIVEVVVAVGFLTSPALLLLGPNPGIALTVWVLAFVACLAAADRVAVVHRANPDHHSISIIPALPIAFALQAVLDRACPLLGSSCVLFGTLAGITSSIRASDYPSARVVQQSQFRSVLRTAKFHARTRGGRA
jgi:hypothetical protein